MLAESLTSAVAVVVVVGAAFRYAYGWDDVITDDVFRGLNKALIVLVLGTLWFLLQDVITGLGPGAPLDEGGIVEGMLYGSISPAFWLAVAGLVIGLAYVVTASLESSAFSVAGSAVAAAIISLSILLKKILFVVEGLLHPTRPPMSDLFPAGEYFPSLVEVLIVVGTIGIAALLFVVVVRLIPIVELEYAEVSDE